MQSSRVLVAAVVAMFALLHPPAVLAAGIVTFAAPSGSGFSVTGIGSGPPTGGSITTFYTDPVIALSGATEETVVLGAGGLASSGAGLWSFGLLPTCCATFSDTGLATQAALGISSILIDLLPGDSLFDRTAPNPGTPGSSSGGDFLLGGFSGIWDLTITYLNPIAVGAALPVGDLYGALRMDFSTPFVAGDSLGFSTDTDTFVGVPVSADLPAPLIPQLVFLGLLALGSLGGRQIAARSR